jgi:hypothetical protein
MEWAPVAVAAAVSALIAWAVAKVRINGLAAEVKTLRKFRHDTSNTITAHEFRLGQLERK